MPMMSFRFVSLLIALLLGGLGVSAAPQQHQPQSKPDHMQHRFDDPERYAKSFDDPARGGWQMPARVIEVLDLSPDASVADSGAGTGYFSVRLAKTVPRGIVYSVDIERPTYFRDLTKSLTKGGRWRSSISGRTRPEVRPWSFASRPIRSSPR